MPLIPIPPIPTKWMGPISRGSLMKLFLVRVLDAPLSPGMTRVILRAVA